MDRIWGDCGTLTVHCEGAHWPDQAWKSGLVLAGSSHLMSELLSFSAQSELQLSPGPVVL